MSKHKHHQSTPQANEANEVERPQANAKRYVEVDYDGPVDAEDHKHVGPFIASGADGTKAMFLPGANEIDADVWAKIKETHGVKWRLEQGYFRVLSEPEGDAHSIVDEPNRVAMELVRNTIEPAILERWLEQEKGSTKPRGFLVKALEDQLSHVEPDPKKRGKPELRPHRLPEGVE